MKKTFRLDGLGCANCAAKMQDKISKVDGVRSASVNFIAAKLVIEGDDGKMDGIIDAARAIIKRIEPDVTMQKV